MLCSVQRGLAQISPASLTVLSSSWRYSSVAGNMKAVTFDKPGGLEVLKYVDVEQPTPGQVRLPCPLMCAPPPSSASRCITVSPSMACSVTQQSTHSDHTRGPRVSIRCVQGKVLNVLGTQCPPPSSPRHAVHAEVL